MTNTPNPDTIYKRKEVMILKSNPITGELESTLKLWFSEKHPKDLVDYYNPEWPTSFYNLLQKDSLFLDELHKSLNTNPEPFCMAETELIHYYKDLSRVPVLRRLKQVFWEDYTQHLRSEVTFKIDPDARFASITKAWRVIIKKPSQLAYICVEPETLMDKATFLLDSGYSYMSSLMELADQDYDGKVNTEVIKIKLKLLDMMDKRMNGNYRQNIKIESKHTNAFGELPMEEQIKLLEKEVSSSGLLTHDK